MHRRHEAVSRGFEWFECRVRCRAHAPAIRSRHPLPRHKRDPSNSAHATPLHHTPTTDASVPITKSSLNYPRRLGPYVPTKVRR